MKLSKAQQKVMDYARSKIDSARKYSTFEEYYDNYLRKNGGYNCSYDELKTYSPKDFERIIEFWMEERECVVRVFCNCVTLRKLESFGLIECIDISEGCRNCIDVIKVLNY